ncbi:MAG: hypothetical protein SVR94_05280 [Pseudomonadota bacterium]|nr:hypothetical protein [Pseudomonadota bacterium]
MTAFINALRENAPPPNPKDYPSVADQFPSLNSSAAINAYLAVFRKTKINRFSKIDIETSLKKRLVHPESIFQGHTSLCGPAAFFYALVTKRADLYVRYVLDIAMYGKTAISIKGKGHPALIVNVPTQLLNTCSGINIVDWLTLATLRNADNPVLGLSCQWSLLNDLASITQPETLASWFRRIGCREVVVKTQRLGTLGLNNLIEAQQRYTRNHSVCLLLQAKVFKTPLQLPLLYPNHWVNLTSNI